jgi:hypothetical protein
MDHQQTSQDCALDFAGRECYLPTAHLRRDVSLVLLAIYAWHFEGEAQDHPGIRALTRPIRLNIAGLWKTKHFLRRGDRVAALDLAEAAKFVNAELVAESDASGSGSGSDVQMSSNLFLYRLSSLMQLIGPARQRRRALVRHRFQVIYTIALPSNL